MSENKDRKTRQARVDLTSQDIRTGTLRLPNRLQGVLGSGVLKARDTVTETIHDLPFSAPRDIGGLTGFFGTHELKPNDAVDIVVDSEMIQITPYYRQRRRQSRDAAPDDAANETRGFAAAESLSNEDPEQRSSAGAHSGDSTTESTGARVALESPMTEPADSSTRSGPAEDGNVPDSGATARAPLTDELLSDSGSTGAARSSDSTDTDPRRQPSEAVEDDPFLAFGSHESGADDEGHDYYPTDELRLPAEEATEAPDGSAPKATLDDAATAEPAIATDAQDGLPDHEAYHHVNRRGFGRPVAGRYRPTPPRIVAGSRSGKGGAAEPEPEASQGPANHPPSPQQPLWEGIDRSPTSLLKGYLAKPDLPSVIQASTLARELELQPVDVDAILAELSLAPDSRISAIRPDFYLVKRTVG